MCVFILISLTHALLTPLFLLHQTLTWLFPHQGHIVFFYCYLAAHPVGLDTAVAMSRTASGTALSPFYASLLAKPFCCLLG